MLHLLPHPAPGLTARAATAIAALVLTLGAALVTAPAPAHAHTLAAQRAVMVQVHADHVEVMVVYSEAPDERSRLFMFKHDFNQDGHIDGPELPLAASAIAPRMLSGLQFEVVGEAPRTREPDYKFKTGKKGEVQIASYVRYDLPRMGDATERTFVVRLASGPDTLPTEVRVVPGEGLTATNRTLVGADAAAPVERDMLTLTRGQELRVTFARPDEPDDGDASASEH